MHTPFAKYLEHERVVDNTPYKHEKRVSFSAIPTGMSFAIEKQQKDLQKRYWNRGAAHHQGLGTSSGPKGRGFVVQLPSLDCQEQKRRGLSVEFDSSAIDVGRASQRPTVTDRFAVGQSPLGHGRHIVAISIRHYPQLTLRHVSPDSSHTAVSPNLPSSPFTFAATFRPLPLGLKLIAVGCYVPCR